MSESKAHPFLTLDLDIGPKPFSDVEELKAWSGEEQKAFSSLNNLYRTDSSAGQAWHQISSLHNVIDTFAREFIFHGGNKSHQENLVDGIRGDAREYTHKHRVKSSESPEVQFVLGLRETRPDTVAGYTLSSLMGQNINFNTSDAVEGIFLAMQYKRGIPETVDAERKALEALKRGWTSRFGKQNNENKKRSEELTTEINEHKNAFASVKDRFDAFYASEEEKFQNLYKKTEAELLDIKRTYDEKLALSSSVRYWTIKKKS